MADEKDRLGSKLQDKERAEEDRYFKERDRALVEKLRGKTASEQEQALRDLARDRCPRCGERLAPIELQGVTVDECPAGHGLWCDKGELETIAQRENDSWLGRLFYRPRV